MVAYIQNKEPEPPELMIPELCAPENAQGNGSSLSVACESMAGPCCNFRDCTTMVRSATYLTMVSPTLEYASTLWDPNKQKDTQLLERVQCRAARYACNNFTDRTPGTIQSQRYRAPSIIPLLTQDTWSVQPLRYRTPGTVQSQTQDTWYVQPLRYRTPGTVQSQRYRAPSIIQSMRCRTPGIAERYQTI